VQRGEFHAAAASLVATMLPALLTAIRASGATTGGVDRLIVTGTAAPTPLLAELLSTELKIPVVVAGPRESGSIGAAWVARAAAPAAADIGPAPVGAAVPVAAAIAVPAAASTLSAASAAADEFGEPDPTTEHRRRPLTLLQLWPITAAAAVLVALAGTLSSGVLDLTPAGSRPSSPASDPAGRTIDTAPDTGRSDAAEPSSGPVETVPVAPATPDAGTTTKKKTGPKASSPAVPVVPVTPDSPSATPTSTPTPTPAPSPDPSTPPPDPTPTPAPTP
jgi:hypothetical protein